MKNLLRSRSGMSLMNVIILLMLVGVLATAGVKMMGPMAQRGKINDTKTTLNSTVDAIISWSVSRGHLPGTAAEFTEASAQQYDAWGRRLRYLYDKNLIATSSTNTICKQTSTDLTINSTSNIAFAVLSLGDDYAAQSTWNSTTIVSDDTKYLYPLHDGTNGAVNTATAISPDIYRVVTLDELKAKIGCFGQTGGRLQIVNNELPKTCAGSSYSTTLYPDGGTGGYNWEIISGTGWNIASDGKLSLSSATDSSVTVQLKDNSEQKVQRTYNLKVVSCSSSPGTPENPIVFNPPTPGVVTDNWNGGTPADEGTNNTGDPSGKFNMTVVDGVLSAISVENGTTANCIWFQRPLSLTGKKLRAYFQFTFQEGTGFSVAIVPAAAGQTTISSCDNNARTGFGPAIPGQPIMAAEFLVNNVNSGTGPGSTCVAINEELCPSDTRVQNWTTATGIPPAPTYYARVELDATVLPNPVLKVWVTSNATHQTALKDFTTAYSGILTPVTRILDSSITNPSQNVTGLSNLFLGFTTGQHGNDKVNMTIADLKFELH